MKKFGFVILNYQTYDYTLKCVESIKNKISEEFEIVIVDNNSPDKSGEKLNKRYEKEKNITVVLNDKNGGFSKGNNIGFKICKYDLKCDYIVMLNSDTIILQNDFCNIVENEYITSEFAVLGPKIKIPDDKIYYYPPNLITLKELRKRILKLKIKRILNLLYLENFVLRIRRNKAEEKIQETIETRMENVVLHGCFFIFSPKYIEKFDGLEEKTFMFNEEDFLYINVIKENLKTVYNPKLVIYHNSSTSIKKAHGKKKNEFLYKNFIIANTILYKYMKKLKKEGVKCIK